MLKLRLYALALSLWLGGCSFQQVLDATVDPARQAQLIELAQGLCRDPIAQRAAFDPQLWAEAETQLAGIASHCPAGGGRNWRLTTFRFNVADSIAGPSTRQEYAVIVEGGDAGPWTEMELSFGQIGDSPLYLTGWAVRRLTERPVSITFIENWERNRVYMMVGGAAFALAIGSLAFWLLRRRRRSGRRLTDA